LLVMTGFSLGMNGDPNWLFNLKIKKDKSKLIYRLGHQIYE